MVVGEITGSESLFIDGIVEGSIDLPEHRVTVGPNGQVTATIVARDVVLLGKVCGSIAVSNLLDIRAEGSLTGDVSAARLSLEDGAFLQGVIDIHKTEDKLGVVLEGLKAGAMVPKQVRAAHAEAAQIRMQPFAQSA
jgi:cytoskeletal protein CcmA (bactofilin family)